MWPNISQDNRVIERSPAGYGFGWQLPLWCPGAMPGIMEMYFTPGTWGEIEIRRLGWAIVARAFRDAASDNDNRRPAVRWLRSGEAAAWCEVLQIKITQPMIEAWLRSPRPLPDWRGIHQRKTR
jgi:hypothetical protein